MSLLHVNRARYDLAVARVRLCPDESRQRVFVDLHQPWYGWDCTCLGCGRRWSDGERMPLPFHRNARGDSKASARKAWRAQPGRSMDRSGPT